MYPGPDIRLNLNRSRWDQRTYWGRAKHFFATTDPLNLLASSEELEIAKNIVTRYKKGELLLELNDDDIWRAKFLYDSAFHPDTGEKMFLIGRMAFQVPGNMFMVASMLTFYKSTAAVIFWQWINQSFNAFVNYSNRNGTATISRDHLTKAYIFGTGGALTAAVGMTVMAKRMSPVISRLVPFAAVAVANTINIPFLRMEEIRDGISLMDDKGQKVAVSSKAAIEGIFQVVLSRIAMVVPTMVIPPIIMNKLEQNGTLAKHPRAAAPFIQFAFVGLVLMFATPMCCALFPQQASISVYRLEPSVQETIKKLPNPPKIVYYNKGL